MSRLPTPGEWREGSLCRTTADWPFHWVAEITAMDPVSGSYTCIGTVRQAGARRYDEAMVNLRVMTRAPAMLRLLQSVAQVLDMSDPDHEAFADSAADCLDALFQQQEPLRELLREVDLVQRQSPVPANDRLVTKDQTFRVTELDRNRQGRSKTTNAGRPGQAGV